MKGLLIISGLGILAMLAEIFKFKKMLFPIVLIGIIAAYFLNFLELKTGMSISYFDKMIFFDKSAIAFSGIILATAFFWFVLAKDYFEEESNLVDHYALVLFALVGALMLTSFKNMTTLFLGIEIMSIPLYVLAASKKKDLKSNEAGFKYLLMGSFASGVLLFGIALIYGASGTFDLLEIKTYISNNKEQLPMFFNVGVIFILVAMCFKVSAAPFHFWAPDVYEGSPTLVTALMSTVVKTAAFAAIMNLFLIGFVNVSETWSGILALIIAATLIIANFSATMQINVKRMLAFSSISHAGFMLMVILANANNALSLNAIIFYSLAYSIGSITAFGVLYNVSSNGNENTASFNGLGKRNPTLALCMTIALLSLAGIPITAGFFAKYFVFITMISSHYKWLLILAILTSTMGVYYYLKIVIAMYFNAAEYPESISVKKSNLLIIVITTFLTLLIGLMPNFVVEMFNF